MKFNIKQSADPELNVSALIDMVFLLLIYFMVTASLVRSEGDLGIELPGVLQQSVAVDMPDEQIVEVRESGKLFLNGSEYGSFDSCELPGLVRTLTRYRLATEAAKNEALLTIWADDNAMHQRIIDVMNACAEAGIKNVTFSSTMD